MKQHCDTQKALKHRKKAFTLVEVLIVVVIIGILFITLMVNLGFSTDKANMAGVQNDFHAFQTAIKVVALEERGLTDNLSELAGHVNKKLDSGLHLSAASGEAAMYSAGVDPWGTNYKLDYTKPTSTTTQIVLISAGPDTQYGTSDDVTSIVTYDTSDGNKVIVDGELQEQDSSIYNTELTFKREINDKEFDKAFDTSTKTSTSTMLAAGPTSYTVYTLVEGSNYSIVGTKDAVSGIRVIKYVANGISYWHLNEAAAAYVGQAEPGWYKVTGSNYERHNSSLGVVIVTTDSISATSHEGLKYLFDGMHEHHFESHVMNAETLKEVGTCVKKAVYYKSCTCGRLSSDTFETEKDPSNHPAKEESYNHNYIQDANDIDKHIHTSTCMQCNTVVIEETQDHSFSGQTCSRCGALKHNHNYNIKLMEATYLKSAATCTVAQTYYFACDCGKYDTSKYYTNGEPLGHIGDPATCTAAAVCTRCDNIYKQALGHDFTKTLLHKDLIATDATCTTDAKYYYMCTRCSVKGTSTWVAYGTALGHTWVETNTDADNLAVAGNCVTAPWYWKICGVCGVKGTEKFQSGTPNENHIGGTRIEYEQIEDDYNEHCVETVCSTCSAVLSTENAVHQTEDNLTCYLCKFEIHVCDYKEKKPTALYLAYPVTCTTPALYYFACEEPNCTKHGVQTYDHGEALGHSYALENTIQPTCTSTGISEYECNRYWEDPTTGNRVDCDSEYSTTIPELGHQFTSSVVDNRYLARAANCKNPASYYLSCARECGAHGESVFTSGTANASNHFGTVISGGTANVCAKYSCCGATSSNKHMYMYESGEYYWCAPAADPTAATSANCSVLVVKIPCACGYVYTNKFTIDTEESVPASCISDGDRMYHYVVATINGEQKIFYCDDPSHNTPLGSNESKYERYKNAYYNTYHILPKALGHNYPSSFADDSYIQVSFDEQNECARAALTLICKRCGKKTYEEDNETVEVETVARACNTPRQWVMQATFSIGSITCEQPGDCRGHVGPAVAHVGTNQPGSYSGNTLVDGTAGTHAACSACKGTKLDAYSHSFTYTVTLSTAHENANTLAKAKALSYTEITLTYKAECDCGYVYRKTVSPNLGTSYQSNKYCDKDKLDRYVFDLDALNVDTGDQGCDQLINDEIMVAVEKATGYATGQCCSYPHLTTPKRGTCNSNKVSSSVACSTSTSSSYYKLYCDKCDQLMETYSTKTYTGPKYTTNGDCKTYRKYKHEVTFKNASGVTVTLTCSSEHTSSVKGSHNYGSAVRNYGCPKDTSYHYEYKTCSICSNKTITAYASSLNNTGHVYVGGSGNGETAVYGPGIGTFNANDLIWIGNWGEAGGCYWLLDDRYVLRFVSGANNSDDRSSSCVTYWDDGTETVLAYGTASNGAEANFTPQKNSSYNVLVSKIVTQEAGLFKSEKYYYKIQIRYNRHYASALANWHSQWPGNCVCDGVGKP